MMQVGRLCVKIAGRDSGAKCVIVDVLEDNYVLVDGETRRKKCNVRHLEPLDKVLGIKKGASHEDVAGEFKKLGIELKAASKKEKAEKPKKTRRSAKSAARKEEKKEAKKAPSKKAQKPKQ